MTGYGGTLTGTILINQSGLPLKGAVVSIPSAGMSATTDVKGQFRLIQIPKEAFSIAVAARGYTPIDAMDVTFNGQLELDIEVGMLHPELAMEPALVTATVNENKSQGLTVNVSNPGDGPLAFSTRVRGNHSEGGLWGQLAEKNVTQMVNDYRVEGALFFQDYFWVTGGRGIGETHYLYKMDRNFTLVDMVEQAAWSSYGWRNLTCDEGYIYAVDSAYIAQIDPYNGMVTGYQIPSPLKITNDVAWDPENKLFWVSNATSDIYGIDWYGNTITKIDNKLRFRIAGMFYFADDPDGFKLYVLSNDASGAVRLFKVNTQTGKDMIVTDLAVGDGERAGGCSITSELYPFTWSMLVQMQSKDDYLRVFEAASNFFWMDLTPTSGQIEAASSLDLNLSLNTEGLENGNTYEAHIQFEHNTPAAGSLWLDVALTVGELGAGETNATPVHFGLDGVYPNPFNATAVVGYRLSVVGNVSLDLFDLNGRLVQTLAEGWQSAGSHEAVIDGAPLPSGMYLVRLSDGVNSSLAKVSLLK